MIGTKEGIIKLFKSNGDLIFSVFKREPITFLLELKKGFIVVCIGKIIEIYENVEYNINTYKNIANHNITKVIEIEKKMVTKANSLLLSCSLEDTIYIIKYYYINYLTKQTYIKIKNYSFNSIIEIPSLKLYVATSINNKLISFISQKDLNEICHIKKNDLNNYENNMLLINEHFLLISGDKELTTIDLLKKEIVQNLNSNYNMKITCLCLLNTNEMNVKIFMSGKNKNDNFIKNYLISCDLKEKKMDIMNYCNNMHNDEIITAGINKNQNILFTGSKDKTVKIWSYYKNTDLNK